MRFLFAALFAIVLPAQITTLEKPHLVEATRLIQQRSLSEAIQLLRRITETHPKDGGSHLLLGSALSMVYQRNEAIQSLLEALELRPDFAPGYITAGMALSRLESKTQPFRSLNKPSISTLKLAMLTCNSRENALESARLHGEAIFLEKSGDYTKALQKYRAVLEFDPLNPVPRRNMALVLCRLNRWDEGIGELQAILRHYPDDAETASSPTLVIDQAREAIIGPGNTVQ